MNYASVATCLGKSKTLDLVVYEIKHHSPHDARVGLSKDAFRMLAGENKTELWLFSFQKITRTITVSR